MAEQGGRYVSPRLRSIHVLSVSEEELPRSDPDFYGRINIKDWPEFDRGLLATADRVVQVAVLHGHDPPTVARLYHFGFALIPDDNTHQR